MKTTEAITKRILELCKERNITPNKLGTISGVEPSTITSIFYGKSKNPGIVTIKNLCDGLDISLAEFFSDDFFNKNLEDWFIMGEKLKELRKSKGVSQKQVADAIGVTLSAYSNYEQGIREPSYDILKKICIFFDTSADFLIGLKDY